MRLTPLEWGLRAPITPRLGGNCWALPRLGEIGAKRRIINRPKTQNFGYFPQLLLGVLEIATAAFIPVTEMQTATESTRLEQPKEIQILAAA